MGPLQWRLILLGPRNYIYLFVFITNQNINQNQVFKCQCKSYADQELETISSTLDNYNLILFRTIHSKILFYHRNHHSKMKQSPARNRRVPKCLPGDENISPKIFLSPIESSMVKTGRQRLVASTPIPKLLTKKMFNFSSDFQSKDHKNNELQE